MIPTSGVGSVPEPRELSNALAAVFVYILTQAGFDTAILYKLYPLNPVIVKLPVTPDARVMVLPAVDLDITAVAPVAPAGPVAPCDPDIPCMPDAPVAPTLPCRPVAPVAPADPDGPAIPVAPVAPAPVAPGYPVAPVAPAAPALPCGPGGPIAAEIHCELSAST